MTRDKARNLTRSIFISLALHAIVFGVLFISILKRQAREPDREVHEISILGATGKADKSNKPNSKPSQEWGARRQGPRSIHLGFGISRGENRKESKSSNPTPDGYAIANSMDLQTESELYGFFDALWRKINANLGYPTDLAEKRMEGDVAIELIVNNEGAFTGRVLKIESDNDYLKAYVMAVLVASLGDPVPKTLGSPERETILVLNFNFKLYSAGHPPPLPQISSHFKNVLSFKRQAYVDPLVKEELERLMAKYLPPILPVPGGIVIDFVRAHEMVKNYNHSDPRDRRDDRVEAMREEWQRVIRK